MDGWMDGWMDGSSDQFNECGVFFFSFFFFVLIFIATLVQRDLSALDAECLKKLSTQFKDKVRLSAE